MKIRLLIRHNIVLLWLQFFALFCIKSYSFSIHSHRMLISSSRNRILQQGIIPSVLRPARCPVSWNTRLLGSRPIPGNPPGEILIDNDQNALNLDLDRLHDSITKIRKLIGYHSYDVALLLVEDEEMRETNLESRDEDAPTDILSFPFHEHVEPGVLVEPDFDIPDYYTLGDMMIDVPYVMRKCEEDQEYEEDDEERGVSGAMATVFDPQQRVNMLLVHGMLHLVGYDHETDEDYELMVEKEEEILRELGFLPKDKDSA